MLDQLNGATRLFPIIGDPVKYAESPVRLTRTFADRGHNGLCVPLQVPEGHLDVVMAGLDCLLECGRDPGHDAAQVRCVCPLHHDC